MCRDHVFDQCKGAKITDSFDLDVGRCRFFGAHCRKHFGREQLPAHRPAAEPIKVGILHSLSGTMTISETTLKDLMLMLVA